MSPRRAARLDLLRSAIGVTALVGVAGLGLRLTGGVRAGAPGSDPAGAAAPLDPVHGLVPSVAGRPPEALALLGEGGAGRAADERSATPPGPGGAGRGADTGSDTGSALGTPVAPLDPTRDERRADAAEPATRDLAAALARRSGWEPGTEAPGRLQAWLLDRGRVRRELRATFERLELPVAERAARFNREMASLRERLTRDLGDRHAQRLAPSLDLCRMDPVSGELRPVDWRGCEVADPLDGVAD